MAGFGRVQCDYQHSFSMSRKKDCYNIHMDTIRKIRTLRHKRSKTNAELLKIAHDLGVVISQQDAALLQAERLNQDRMDACQDARERLLMKLDVYQSGVRSKLSRTLSIISVILSIFSALATIYAHLVKGK